MREQLRSGIAHVGQALRTAEDFAVAWNEGQVSYRWWVWLSLMGTAILGTATYGMTMGLLGHAGDVVHKGLSCTLAAGLAWGIPLPGAVHPQQPVGIAIAPEQHVSGGSRHDELGRVGDDRVDSDQLVLLGCSAAFRVCAARQLDGLRWRRCGDDRRVQPRDAATRTAARNHSDVVAADPRSDRQRAVLQLRTV